MMFTSRRHLALVVPLAAALVLSACSSDSDDAPASSTEASASESLTVLGAASTRVLNDDLVDLSGMDLEFINAGSSTLVQQLAVGSPGDVLITADQATMDRAVDEGVAEDPQVVATNSMVMVVPAGNPAGITSADDLAGHAVVLCDEQVPCGAVSRKIIEDSGIDVTPVSLEHAVSDVLGKVVSGEADAGWVYRTDAAAAGDDVEVIDLPGAGDHPNSLVAAVTTTAVDKRAAGTFVELLRSDDMAEVWTRHGFTPAN